MTSDQDRQSALRDYHVLDTAPDERFDRITALAAELFDVPIALVSLLDAERQWFKSAHGLEARETPRSWAFCEHAVQGGPDTVMVVTDATADERFRDNPLVVGPPDIRFYAGAVLATAEGVCLGTLCIIDSKPRPAPAIGDLGRLKLLAKMVMDQLELTKSASAVSEHLNLLQMAEAMSGVGHWRLDVVLKQVTWSEEVYRIHGVDRASFDPNFNSAVEFYHPDDQATVNALVARAIETQAPHSFQLRLRRPDGSIRHVVSKAECEVNAMGATVAIYGVFQDITDTVTTLDRVEKSEARYRLLTENTNDLVTEADLQGRFRYVSPAVKVMTGYTADEAIGHRGLEWTHPDDHPRVRRAFEAAVAGSPTNRIEFRIIHRDGQIRWLEARPTAARAADGKVFGVTDVVRDITARKATEAALSESEARYRLLADNASDMIVSLKADGVIIFSSPGCRFLGYEPAELVGRRVHDMTHPDDQAMLTAYYLALFAAGAGGAAEPFQFRGRHKGGHWVWLEGQPKVFFESVTGKPIAIQDVVRDISKRKELEFELAHARVAAEAAAAIKTEFLSNMSHELRTPLTSILGFSSLLEEDQGLSEQSRKSVNRIVGSGRALLTIVNDILDFSKLEAGQVEIEQTAVNPRAAFAEALGLLEPLAADKAIGLVLDVGAKTPEHLLLDEARVRQVLLNLLSNAVKFSSEGQVTVKARYDVGLERLRCEVIDTGPGISPDGLDRLFQRFSQVDASMTRSHGGTGLGLAICKGLIEAMGGAIGANSVLGEGSCFWFELPAQAAAPKAQPRQHDHQNHFAELKGMRLLVVDDNAINRELIRLMLEPFEIVVAEAGSGEEAIRLSATAPYDLLLIDIRMPGLDGPVTAKTIREGGGPNDLVPIMAFTAQDAESAETQPWAAVFDDQIAKPVVLSDLLATLARWAPTAPQFLAPAV